MVSKDGCSQVTPMEVSLWAVAGGQLFCLDQCHNSRHHCDLIPRMTKPCDR